MKLLQEENGSAIVIVALALTVILGAVGLVTDVGLLYLNKTRLNVLADSAALAGVQEIPNGLLKAQETAKQYALENGAKTEELEISGSEAEMKLTVKAKREINFLFAKVLGLDSSWVEADSTAQAGYLTATTGVAPLGIEEQNLVYGQLYTLKTGSPPSIGAGEFGALVLGNPGGDNYEQFLTHGYPNEITIGSILPTQTGNISNPTVRAIENRFLRDSRIPKNTITDYDRDSPQILIVPVYVPYEVNSNQLRKVKVTGFAAFFVTELAGQGNANYLSGYFIKTLAPGDSEFSQKNFGLMGVKLVD